MKINNFQGDLTDISAKKEPLLMNMCTRRQKRKAKARLNLHLSQK